MECDICEQPVMDENHGLIESEGSDWYICGNCLSLLEDGETIESLLERFDDCDYMEV